MKVFIQKGNAAQMEKCNSAQEALAAIAQALDDNVQHVSVEIKCGVRYRTCSVTNAMAKCSVKVVCTGEGAATLAKQMKDALVKENRRRRHCGDHPISFDIQALSETAYTSS